MVVCHPIARRFARVRRLALCVALAASCVLTPRGGGTLRAQEAGGAPEVDAPLGSATLSSPAAVVVALRADGYAAAERWLLMDAAAADVLTRGTLASLLRDPPEVGRRTRRPILASFGEVPPLDGGAFAALARTRVTRMEMAADEPRRLATAVIRRLRREGFVDAARGTARCGPACWPLLSAGRSVAVMATAHRVVIIAAEHPPEATDAPRAALRTIVRDVRALAELGSVATDFGLRALLSAPEPLAASVRPRRMAELAVVELLGARPAGGGPFHPPLWESAEGAAAAVWTALLADGGAAPILVWARGGDEPALRLQASWAYGAAAAVLDGAVRLAPSAGDEEARVSGRLPAFALRALTASAPVTLGELPFGAAELAAWLGSPARRLRGWAQSQAGLTDVQAGTALRGARGAAFAVTGTGASVAVTYSDETALFAARQALLGPDGGAWRRVPGVSATVAATNSAGSVAAFEPLSAGEGGSVDVTLAPGAMRATWQGPALRLRLRVADGGRWLTGALTPVGAAAPSPGPIAALAAASGGSDRTRGKARTCLAGCLAGLAAAERAGVGDEAALRRGALALTRAPTCFGAESRWRPVAEQLAAYGELLLARAELRWRRIEEARPHLQRACEAGHPEACARLGATPRRWLGPRKLPPVLFVAALDRESAVDGAPRVVVADGRLTVDGRPACETPLNWEALPGCLSTALSTDATVAGGVRARATAPVLEMERDLRWDRAALVLKALGGAFAALTMTLDEGPRQLPLRSAAGSDTFAVEVALHARGARVRGVGAEAEEVPAAGPDADDLAGLLRTADGSWATGVDTVRIRASADVPWRRVVAVAAALRARRSGPDAPDLAGSEPRSTAGAVDWLFPNVEIDTTTGGTESPGDGKEGRP